MCMQCMANGDFLLTSGILGVASARVGLRRFRPELRKPREAAPEGPGRSNAPLDDDGGAASEPDVGAGAATSYRPSSGAGEAPDGVTPAPALAHAPTPASAQSHAPAPAPAQSHAPAQAHAARTDHRAFAGR